jgi:hypothetical protein
MRVYVRGKRIKMGTELRVAMNQSAIDRRLEGDEGIAIEQLEVLLRSRPNGRVCDLRMVESGAGIVLQGHSTTFDAK